MQSIERRQSRTELLQFRVSPAEKQAILDAAWQARKSLADYVREKLLADLKEGA